MFELRGTAAEFDVRSRTAVLGMIKRTVTLGTMDFRLPSLIRETVASYARALETGKGSLALPG